MKKEIKAYVDDFARDSLHRNEGKIIHSFLSTISNLKTKDYKHEITITINEPLTFDYIKNNCKNGDKFRDHNGHIAFLSDLTFTERRSSIMNQM